MARVPRVIRSTPVGRVAVAVILAWAFVVAASWQAQERLLSWDEVSYANAAEMGFVSNWMESGALSAKSFAALVRARLHRAPFVSPARYVEERDPLLLRHLHPPLMVYLLTPVPDSGSERIHRVPLLLVALGMLSGLIFGLARLGRTDSWSLVLGSSVGGWASVQVAERIQFHGLAAATALAAVAAGCAWRESRSERARLTLIVFLALLALSLETSVVVWGALGLWLWRNQIEAREVAKVYGWALLLVLVLWPGGLINVSPARTAANYAYRFMLGDEYATVGARVPLLIWSLLPFLVLVMMSAVVWLRRSRAIECTPVCGAYMWCGAAYGLVMVPVGLSVTYQLPAVMLLSVPAIAIVGSRGVGRLAKGVTLVLVVASVVAVQASRSDGASVTSQRADLEWLEVTVAGERLMADGAHIFQWYHPNLDIRAINVAPGGAALLRRIAGNYEPLTRAELIGGFVLILTRRGDVREIASNELLSGCSATERTLFLLFDCRWLSGD